MLVLKATFILPSGELTSFFGDEQEYNNVQLTINNVQLTIKSDSFFIFWMMIFITQR